MIAIKPRPVPEDRWTEGGTYLAFLRLGVNLSTWRNLDRRQQELMVGRDKLSGCALTSLGDGENPVAQNGCPVSGTREIDVSGGPNDLFREPPDIAASVLRQSHVQRANHHVQPASDRNSLCQF